MKRFASTLPMLLAGGVLAGCTAHPQAPGFQDSSSLRTSHEALDEGQAATALSIARGVLSLRPHDAGALVAAGDAEAALGNHRMAEEHYRAALVEASGNVAARLGLAKLKLASDAAAAEADLHAILRDAPHDPAVLTDLAVAQDLQEQHQAAQANYAAALAISPGLTSARVDLALSMALTGQSGQAEALLRDASEGNAVPAKVRADFALAQVMAGHSDDAMHTLQPDLSEDEAKQSVIAMETLRPAAH